MPEKATGLSYERTPSNAWYVFLQKVFWLLFHTIWPLRVYGAENVPRKGPAIIVSNHVTYVDPFIVGYGAGRLVNFMAKQELFSVPVVGFILRKLGAFPVDRSRSDASSMRIALSVLKGGELLGMFPEGTRSTTGDMNEFRTGAIRIAARTQTPVIPAAVRNTIRAMPPGKFIRPARISIRFGEPIEFTELYDRNDKGEALERALVTIRESIEALNQ